MPVSFRNITIVYILTAMMVMVPASLAAQTSGKPAVVREELSETTLYFGFDKKYLDTNYRGNGATLENLAAKIVSIGEENIDAIEITSFTSPQGVYEHNMVLAKERLASVKWYFTQTWPELREKMSFEQGGESWDKLRSYIESDTTLSEAQKSAAISIIDADVNQGTKKWRMERLPFYRYLDQNYYYRLRSACAVLVKYRVIEPEVEEIPEPAEETVAEPVVEEVIEPMVPALEPAEPAVEPEVRGWNGGNMVLKTNLLYDLALVPNAAVEFAFGNFSAYAGGHFTWIQSSSKAVFYQTYGAEAGLRYWFAKRNGLNFTGHHAGVYGQVQTFDFEFGGKGLQMPDPAFGGGIEYGYSLPIARNFNLDFEVGVGYFTGTTLEYEPHDGHYVWQQTNRLRWFGPTKLGVTLIWTPFNSRKGGRR